MSISNRWHERKRSEEFKKCEWSEMSSVHHVNMKVLRNTDTLIPHLVLAAEKGLLILVLAHVAKGVGLLASDGQGHPNIVEDVGLLRRAL